MKKVLIGALAVALLTSPFALLHAEKATSSTTSKPWRGEEQRERNEWREKMMFGDRMEGLQEKMQERREEMHARFDATRADVITNILNRLEERFQKAIDRMSSIAERIQARITLLKNTGASLDDAQSFLDDAKDGIKDAQKALDDIDLTDAVATTTPATALKNVRAEFAVVKELLKTAHSKLSDAVSSIKKGLSTATTTESGDDN